MLRVNPKASNSAWVWSGLTQGLIKFSPGFRFYGLSLPRGRFLAMGLTRIPQICSVLDPQRVSETSFQKDLTLGHFRYDFLVDHMSLG